MREEREEVSQIPLVIKAIALWRRKQIIFFQRTCESIDSIEGHKGGNKESKESRHDDKVK
jgi:hypothetical protein